MINPEFKYVGYKSSLESRTNIYELDKVPNDKKNENYRTIYRFSETILSHDSIRDIGSDELFYSDYLYFDIDFEELDTAKEELGKLTLFLDEYDIGYETWFSGCKGFHVLVPTIQFNFQPTSDERILKQMALSIAVNAGVKIDEAIYNVSRVIREPYSIHRKTKKTKVPYPDEKAEYVGPEDYVENDTLTNLYKEVLGKFSKPVSRADAPKSGAMLKIFQDVEKGSRNATCFKAVKYLRERKILQDDIRSLIYFWNERYCNPPLDDKEIDVTIRSALRGDVSYVVEDKDRKTRIHGPRESLKRIMTEYKDFNRTVVKTGYSFFDRYTMGLFPGDMIFWLAVNGNFKTAILSSFAQKISETSDKYSVIFSADMPETKLQLRHMAYSEGISIKETLNRVRRGAKFSIFETAFKKVLVIECPSLSVDDMYKDIDFIQSEIGELGLIGIDYLGALRGCDNDNIATGRAIHDIHTMTKTVGACPTICLVQGRREYEGSQGGNVQIDKVAGKDTSAIEHKADFVLGSWWHKLPGHPVEYWGRFLKARQFDSEQFEAKAYFNLELVPEQMKLAGIKYRKDHPEFNQKRIRQS